MQNAGSATLIQRQIPVWRYVRNHVNDVTVTVTARHCGSLLVITTTATDWLTNICQD